MHNIIKRFKESGGISVRKGQGRKPKLNNRDLRSLRRRHCIKNRHSSISDITTWAQDYFGKPLSSTTIRRYIHKWQLKLYCAKRKPYVNSVQKRRRLLWARRHLGWTITQWKRVLWSDGLQSRPVSNRECVPHFEAQNATTKTPYCCPP